VFWVADQSKETTPIAGLVDEFGFQRLRHQHMASREDFRDIAEVLFGESYGILLLDEDESVRFIAGAFDLQEHLASF
jgi:hypothetical protein